MIHAAGILVVSRSTRRVLLQRRADDGRWDFPGGTLDATDDSVLAGAYREFVEETGYTGDIHVVTGPLTTGNGFAAFVAVVPREFISRISSEHTAWGWFSFEDALFFPLHSDAGCYLVAALES
jgi:8-oxo-dGTP pyrophosphatase MutT (NUDIX family)